MQLLPFNSLWSLPGSLSVSFLRQNCHSAPCTCFIQQGSLPSSLFFCANRIRSSFFMTRSSCQPRYSIPQQTLPRNSMRQLPPCQNPYHALFAAHAPQLLRFQSLSLDLRNPQLAPGCGAHARSANPSRWIRNSMCCGHARLAGDSSLQKSI